MKNKSFLLLVFSVILSNHHINCSEKYTIDDAIMNIKDISRGIPKLQYICKQVVRTNWNETVNKAFELVDKDLYTQDDVSSLKNILMYNQYLQSDPGVIANIQLPSIFDIENENKQKIIDYMLNQKDSRAVIMALEHGLSLYEYKQAVLKQFYTIADKAFTGLDLNKTLAHHQKLSHDALTIANLTLPSLFQLRDAPSDTLINGGNQRLIDYVIDNNHTEGLLAMLEHGFDVYECDEKHNTLLHRSIKEYKPDLLTILLVNINSTELEHHHKIEWINMLNLEGKSALSWAAESNSYDMIESLLNAGANPGQVDCDGKTALHHVVTNEYDLEDIGHDTILLLLNAGINVNQPDNAGYTALHSAVINNNDFMISTLLNAGANVNQTDNEGKTPLFYAEQQQSHEAIAILRSAGGLIIEPASMRIKADNEENSKHQKLN